MINAIPERIIQDVIIQGLRAFRSSPKMLAILFQNLTDPEFQRIVSFITKSAINFSVNYPRKDLTPPSIVLLLKGEQESLQFLGDHMGTSPDYGMPPEEHTFSTLADASSVITPTPAASKLIGPLSVEAATPNSIEIDNEAFSEWVNNPGTPISALKLYVIAGTGKGKVYDIENLTTSSIDIQGTFTVLLDTSSKVDIRQSNTFLPRGEPARVYNEDAVLTRHGAYYGATYTLDIISGQQEEVIYLYSVVKAIFFLFKKHLEVQGIQNLIISGTDFAPRSEFLPDHVFQRAMNLEFTYPFSVVSEEDVVKQLELCMTVEGIHTSLGTITIESE